MRRTVFALVLATCSASALAAPTYGPELNADPTSTNSSAWMSMGSSTPHVTITGGVINANGATGMEMFMQSNAAVHKGDRLAYSYDIVSYTSGVVRPFVGMNRGTATYTPRVAVDLNGLAAIEETPSWTLPSGTTPAAIPAVDSMGSDIMGAFRLECLGGVIAPIDPEVQPGLDGMSHLHQFFGGTFVSSKATFANLRKHGGSTCGTDQIHPLNKSQYWLPAMLDGNGHAVRAYYAQTYYKRQPSGSSYCNPASADFVGGPGGGCINMPNGMQFLVGYNMSTGVGGPFDDIQGGPAIIKYGCSSRDELTVYAYSNHLSDLYGGVCPIGSLVNIQFTSPDCWNGTDLDSPTHRTHIINPNVLHTDSVGGLFFACPADHPWKVPNLQFSPFWIADAQLVAGKWHLASDEMVPGALPGQTAHFDYMEAWKRAAKVAWETQCINRHASGSAGNLCDGTQIAGDAGKPTPPLLNQYNSLADFGYGKERQAVGHYSGEFTAPASGTLGFMFMDDASHNAAVMTLDNLSIKKMTNGRKGPSTVHVHGG